MVTSKLSMSSRTKLTLSFALFAPAALIILTGPSPRAVFQYFARGQHGSWTQVGERALAFSLIADALALLACMAACLMIFRLAHRLRDRVPFVLTTYILGVFIVCFAFQRLVVYAMIFWDPQGRLGPELQMVRAAAAVVVAMGAAILFPYVRSMIGAIISAARDRERFVAAAESSMDSFYVLESLRDPSEIHPGLPLYLRQRER